MPDIRAVLFDMYGTLVNIKTDEHRDDVFESLSRFLEYRRVFIPGQGLKEAVAALEAQVIRGALERHEHMSQVARALGVHPSTLWRKMVKYGLQN